LAAPAPALSRPPAVALAYGLLLAAMAIGQLADPKQWST
jgi:hypothetical protein